MRNVAINKVIGKQNFNVDNEVVKNQHKSMRFELLRRMSPSPNLHVLKLNLCFTFFCVVTMRHTPSSDFIVLNNKWTVRVKTLNYSKSYVLVV